MSPRVERRAYSAVMFGHLVAIVAPQPGAYARLEGGGFRQLARCRVSPEASAEGAIIHVTEALSAQLIDQIGCRVNTEHTFREDLMYK